MKKSLIWLLFLLALGASSGLTAEEKLAPRHKEWLENVSPIITGAEDEIFRQLRTEAERDKFIHFFWRQRDPLPDTEDNEFYREYMERVRFADRYFGIGASKRGSQTERGYFYLLLGKPLERTFYTTHSEIWPLELWFYKGEAEYEMPPHFYLIFYQPSGVGDYRLYYPGSEGPERLAIPSMSQETLTRARAVQVVKKVNAELARASLSYIPGETPMSGASFSSDSLIASVKGLPEKKYSDSYARSYLKYKDHIETDYSHNYVDSSFLVRVFRESGRSFVHWSIEPEKISFSRTGGSVYANFELVLRLEDRRGNLVFEKVEEIPVKMTPGQYTQHERRHLAFQDLMPVIPGEYKIFFLLKNKTGKDFSSFEAALSVPDDATGPRMSGLLLYHSREGSAAPAAAGAGKRGLQAFSWQGDPRPFNARNEFLPRESLSCFVQVYAADGLPAPGPVSARISIRAVESEAVVAEAGVDWADIPAPGDGIVLGPLPLSSLKPGYYAAEVSVVSGGGGTLLSGRDHLIILDRPYPVLPWALSRVHSSYPSAEALNILASQYFMTKNYTEAGRLAGEALRLKDEPAARLILAKSLFALNRFQESLAAALPLYEAGLDREAAKVMALDYAGLKDWTSAAGILEKLMAESTEVGVLNLAAECYLNLGRPEKALPLLEKSLSLEPAQKDIADKKDRALKLAQNE